MQAITLTSQENHQGRLLIFKYSLKQLSFRMSQVYIDYAHVTGYP